MVGAAIKDLMLSSLLFLDSTIISRICANSRTIAFSHECQYFETVDGHSRRCYCDTDLCNGAWRSASAAALPLLIISSVLITFWNLLYFCTFRHIHICM